MAIMFSYYFGLQFPALLHLPLLRLTEVVCRILMVRHSREKLRRPKIDKVKRKSCHIAKWFLCSRDNTGGMDEFDNGSVSKMATRSNHGTEVDGATYQFEMRVFYLIPRHRMYFGWLVAADNFDEVKG